MITKFKIFEALNQKKLILLVGPPGSGKSYYIRKVNADGEYIVINRDDIVTEVAEENGLTYKEMFNRTNLILGEDREFHSEDPEYYEKDGKIYVKGLEKFGEVVDLPENHYARKWIDKQFKLLLELNDEVDRRFSNMFNNALNSNMSIIIDMTNVYKAARKMMIDKLGDKRNEYIVKAVIFNKGGVGLDNLIISVNRKRDIELRKSKKEKDIPDTVLKSFITKYEEPVVPDEVDEVEYIDNKSNLEKYIQEEMNEKFKFGNLKKTLRYLILSGILTISAVSGLMANYSKEEILKNYINITNEEKIKSDKKIINFLQGDTLLPVIFYAIDQSQNYDDYYVISKIQSDSSKNLGISNKYVSVINGYIRQNKTEDEYLDMNKNPLDKKYKIINFEIRKESKINVNLFDLVNQYMKKNWKTEIELNSRFYDLGMDEQDIFQIIVYLENKIGKKIDNVKIYEMLLDKNITVGQFLKAIENL